MPSALRVNTGNPPWVPPPPANESPIAADQSITIVEDTPGPVTLTATDAEDPMTLTYAIDVGPTHGTLGAVVGAQVTYTPTTGYTGPDSFTFHANDGTDDSNVATVTIDVIAAANVPPVAEDQAVDVDQDTPTAITLVATDPDA